MLSGRIKRARCDFRVRIDPAIDTQESITKKIFYSLFIENRLRADKPCVIFIGGDSGEGKSSATLRFQEILSEIQGWPLAPYLADLNIVSPLEYATKMDNLMDAEKCPRLKKQNVVTFHEARLIVSSKKWQDFLTQAVNEVNTLSRAIKPMLTLIVSQFVRDITTDTRYTLQFYGTVSRSAGKSAKLYLRRVWKDDRDIDNPKLRKRKISGYLIYPDGKHQRYIIPYFSMSKPSKEVAEEFHKMDIAAKAPILRQRLEKMTQAMQSELGMKNTRIEGMLDWVGNDTEKIASMGKLWHGKWRMKKESASMLGLSKTEIKDFEERLHQKLKQEGKLQ